MIDYNRNLTIIFYLNKIEIFRIIVFQKKLNKNTNMLHT